MRTVGLTLATLLIVPLILPIVLIRLEGQQVGGQKIEDDAGEPIKVDVGPELIAITPNGKTAYVAVLSSRRVIPINTATNTAGKPIKVGLGPDFIAFTPNGETAYVANYNSGTVTPIRSAMLAARCIVVRQSPSTGMRTASLEASTPCSKLLV